MATGEEIQHNIQDEVLETRSYPDIRFAAPNVTAEGDGFRLAGELTVHGKTRPLSVVARRHGDRMVAEIDLHQPSFGIKPYSAMLGTLKIKPDVRVRCSVPCDKLPLPKR